MKWKNKSNVDKDRISIYKWICVFGVWYQWIYSALINSPERKQQNGIPTKIINYAVLLLIMVVCIVNFVSKHKTSGCNVYWGSLLHNNIQS